MSDHGTHHHDGDNNTGEPKSKTAFRSSFWLVLILAGLFIAALNFIHVMGHSEGHEQKEATATGTLKGETGLGRDKEDATEHQGAAPAHDTAHHEGHE